MKKGKPFDCVQMKRAIQAKLAEEYEGLDAEEIRARRAQKLAISKKPAARKWRAIAQAEEAAAKHR